MNPNDQVEITFGVVGVPANTKNDDGTETFCRRCTTLLKDGTCNNYKDGRALLISPLFKNTVFRYSGKEFLSTK